MPKDLKIIPRVEIFSTGTWNGDAYTEADLDAMIQAFEDNPNFRPPIKFGHTEEQKLAQIDGMPAIGWVGKIFREGSKLFAELVDIPSKVFDLLQTRAYRKVSSEIYWNIDINGKKYKRMLGGLALLGADLPGVQNLNDILAFYGLKDFETIKSYAKIESTSKTYLYDNPEVPRMEKTEGQVKAETELKAAQDALKKASDDAKKFKADLEKVTTENKELKEYKVESEKEKLEAAKKLEAEKVKNFAEGLVKDELASKAMVPFITSFLGEEKKEYTQGDKKVSKAEYFKEMLKLFKAACDVNFQEESSTGKKKLGSSNEAALEEKIEKYMSENKCSYKTAYKAIMVSVKEDESPSDE